MPKANVTFEIGKTTVTMEIGAETQGGLFKAIGDIQEIAHRAKKCDNCGESAVKFNVRVVAPNSEKGTRGGTFYELRCLNCGASLPIHQRKPENGGGFYLKYDEKFQRYGGGAGVNSSGEESVPF